MYNIFDIDDIVGHILSFVPRSMIGPSLLVNKRFNKMIKVDDDYESVIMNTDFYSLNKIKYSPIAVMKVAKKYRNFDLMEWMLRHKMHLLRKVWTVMGDLIGFVGKEEFFGDVSRSDLLVGICEGLHFNLMGKYCNFRLGSENWRIAEFAFRMGGDIQNKILTTFKITIPYLSSQIAGNCSKYDKEYVKTYINNTIHLFPNDSSIYDYICIGLIGGEHFDIFIEFSNEYLCEGTDLLKTLIMNNNYEFFKFVIMNNCMVPLYDGIKYCDKFTENWDGISFYDLVIYCIHFKRIDMILFLTKEITFSLEFYNKFLDEVRMLKFDDIEKVFVDNYGLFKTLR